MSAKARDRGGRAKGQTSRAIKRTSRANGRKGGRPRSELGDALKQLGDAPLGQPLKLARWFTDAIALLTQLCLEGGPYRQLLDLVRSSAAAAGKVLPHDVIFEANKRLAADEKELAQTSTGARVVARKDDDVARSARPSRRDPT